MELAEGFEAPFLEAPAVQQKQSKLDRQTPIYLLRAGLYQ